MIQTLGEIPPFATMFSTSFQLQIEVEDDKYNCKMFFATTTFFFATIYPKKSTSWKQQTYVKTMDIDHFSCKPTNQYSWKSFSTMIHVWMNFIYWCYMASFAYHYSQRSFSISWWDPFIDFAWYHQIYLQVRLCCNSIGQKVN